MFCKTVRVASVAVGVVTGVLLASSQALAAYRCELFDRAENAPGGDVPAKVLFTDSENFEFSKEACSDLVDGRNFVDYALVWIPQSGLPANWRDSVLVVADQLVERPVIDIPASKIIGSGLPGNVENPVIEGASLRLVGFGPAADSPLLNLEKLSMTVLVPGYLSESPDGSGEYVHSVAFEVDAAKIEKIMGGSHAGFSSYQVTFVPGSVIQLTTEGYTQKADLLGVAWFGGGSDEVTLQVTFKPEGGVTRTLQYTLLGY